MNYLVQLVKEENRNKQIISIYKRVGLWPAEEILVTRYFNLHGKVLDLGCGAGRTTIALKKMGYNATGIDLMPEMIEAAKEQAKEHEMTVELKVMDASSLMFGDAVFDDILFSYNGYEQIPGNEKRKKVLQEVYRVLKPGGVFIITSRSGIALGRRWLGWVWMYFREYILKKIGLVKRQYELGDMVYNKIYHHYSSPRKIKNDLLKVGFKFLYFNSRRNIERNRPATLFTAVSRDKSLFFVAQKPEG